jgi:hypothetical protein
MTEGMQALTNMFSGARGNRVSVWTDIGVFSGTLGHCTDAVLILDTPEAAMFDHQGGFRGRMELAGGNLKVMVSQIRAFQFTD